MRNIYSNKSTRPNSKASKGLSKRRASDYVIAKRQEALTKDLIFNARRPTAPEEM